ncbi:MAG: peptide ABC transporter substrate-binding protein [Tissierellia bacterium]|nr:peptide ABC transporter substrate-binding protein [Tissierellia bacterium]
MRRRHLGMMALVLAILMTLTACGGGGSGGTSESTYRYLYSGEIQTMNYLVTPNIDDFVFPANTVDTLIEFDNKGQIREGLATKWDYDEEKLTWTLELREAKWIDHNGEEVADVTAQDFVDALKYALDPGNESGTVQLTFGVINNAEKYFNGLAYNGEADEDGVVWDPIDFEEVGVKALDDHTLEYTLEQPVPYFLSSLAYVVYMPAYGPQLEELGKDFATSMDKMYYNGAYYISEYEPQSHRVLTKNPLNYDADNVFIERIEAQYNAEASTMGPEMVKRGETDYAVIGSEIMDDWMNNDETKDLISRARVTTDLSYFYCFNFNPQFDAEFEPDNWKLAVNNENFRKALFYGLNKEKELAVVEPTAPENFVLNTITPKNFASLEDGTDFATVGGLGDLENTFNPEEAVKYRDLAKPELEAAGVTFPIKVLMPYNPIVTDWDKECQVAEQQLEELLGADFIDVIAQAGPTDNFLAQVRRAGNYAFMKCNWGADYQDPETWTDPFYQAAGANGYDDGMSYAFLGTSVTDGGASSDTIKEYFDLLEKAKENTNNDITRYEGFAKAEKHLIDHALVLPFSLSNSNYVATKLNVFEGQYAPFGISSYRYKGMKLRDNFISMEEFEEERAAMEDN